MVYLQYLILFLSWGIEGELYFQPKAGEQVIQPQVSYSDFAQRSGTFKTEQSFTEVSSSYWYGLNDDLAFGGDLGVRSANFKSDNPSYKTTGLRDVVLSVRGRSAKEQAMLRYGADLSLSLEATKINSIGEVTNAYSGENTLTPYFGLEFDMGSAAHLGISLSREILIGDRVLDSEANGREKSSGGELTLFNLYYENQWSEKFLFGGRIAYIGRSKTKDKTTGFTGESTSFMDLLIYSRVQVQNAGFVVPSLGYTTILKNEMNGFKIDSNRTITLSMDYRFVF